MGAVLGPRGLHSPHLASTKDPRSASPADRVMAACPRRGPSSSDQGVSTNLNACTRPRLVSRPRQVHPPKVLPNRTGCPIPVSSFRGVCGRGRGGKTGRLGPYRGLVSSKTRSRAQCIGVACSRTWVFSFEASTITASHFQAFEAYRAPSVCSGIDRVHNDGVATAIKDEYVICCPIGAGTGRICLAQQFKTIASTHTSLHIPDSFGTVYQAKRGYCGFGTEKPAVPALHHWRMLNLCSRTKVSRSQYLAVTLRCIGFRPFIVYCPVGWDAS